VIAAIKSETPSQFIHRQLDDLIIVAPKDSGICEKFSLCYKALCKSCNVELAEDCPKAEKAFTNQTRGKVLGILFDSNDLTWSIPSKKLEKCLFLVEKALSEKKLSLLDLQRLHGRLNDICQMMPFMKIFKQPLNDC
jgi:hypothetical protein